MRQQYQESDLLIRWAYLFEELRPLHTSTCELWWRSVVLTPLKLLGPLFFVGSVLTVWTAFVWTAIESPNPRDWALLKSLGMVLGTIAGVAGLVWLGEVIGFWTYLRSFCLPVDI